MTKQGFPAAADTRSLAAALGVEIRGSVRDPRDHLLLARYWWLALDTETLRLHRTGVVAGPTLGALEEAVAGDADPDQTLRVWKDIADIAVTGPTQLNAKDDSAVRKLGEFSRPWGPRALGELYRADGPAQIDDLVDTLVTDYHGPLAEEALAMMIGAAVRTGLLAGTEAGAVAVTLPADAEIDSEIAQLVDGSGGILGEPAWAVASIAGVRVELTSLGRHLVRLNLLAEGSHAPLLEPTSTVSKQLAAGALAEVGATVPTRG